jgi:hypothetical protein
MTLPGRDQQGAPHDGAVSASGTVAQTVQLGAQRFAAALLTELSVTKWLKEHAGKLNPSALSNAHRHASTHSPSTTSRNNHVHRSDPVNHGICPGFLGVCDTVLTQSGDDLHGGTSTDIDVRSESIRRPASRRSTGSKLTPPHSVKQKTPKARRVLDMDRSAALRVKCR